MSASTRSDGYEEERLALIRQGIERGVAESGAAFEQLRVAHQGITAERETYCAALRDIASKADLAITHGPKAGILKDIRQRAHEALHIPQVGKRVACLIEHRGEQGTVVGWDDDLRLPLVTWDVAIGQPPEAMEPGEYEMLS